MKHGQPFGIFVSCVIYLFIYLFIIIIIIIIVIIIIIIIIIIIPCMFVVILSEWSFV